MIAFLESLSPLQAVATAGIGAPVAALDIAREQVRCALAAVGSVEDGMCREVRLGEHAWKLADIAKLALELHAACTLAAQADAAAALTSEHRDAA